MKPYSKPQIAVAVLTQGFVYVGEVTVNKDSVIIRRSAAVRRWGTTKGLGQLADSGPTKETQLDPAPDVYVPIHSLVHLISCSGEAWANHLK